LEVEAVIFANGYIAAAFIIAGLILLAMIVYAVLRLRAAAARLEAVDPRARR
jgi:hypothetical protein